MPSLFMHVNNKKMNKESGKMYKKKVSILLVIAMLLTLFIPQLTASAAEEPEVYRTLLDVQIY